MRERGKVILDPRDPMQAARALVAARSALEGIKEVLQWLPLEAFKAEHLEFLELLIAYWRKLEVEAGAPEPDDLH